MTSTVSAKHTDLYKRSVIFIIIGGACLSLLGIGMRLMQEANGIQVVFYRSLFQGLFLSLLLIFTQRKRLVKIVRDTGRLGLLASFLMAIAGWAIVLAIENTSVANAVFIVSLAPLSSALFGRLFLNEKVSLRTWRAIIIALIGICIIFASALTAGGLLGIFYSVIMALCYSLFLVVIRSQNQADMVVVCAISGFLLALIALPFVPSLTIPLNDLIICIALGIFQVGLGLVLITKGAEHVPTAQVSLLALLEVILSPIWVWLGVGENPGTVSLIGGAIVLLGVMYQATQRNSQRSLH